MGARTRKDLDFGLSFVKALDKIRGCQKVVHGSEPCLQKAGCIDEGANLRGAGAVKYLQRVADPLHCQPKLVQLFEVDLFSNRARSGRQQGLAARGEHSPRVEPWLQNGVFQPTGETLAQIENRVLPGVSDSTRVPLYTATPGWWIWNVQGGYKLGETWSVTGSVRNLLDRNYRVHGSGVDAPGLHAFAGLRFSF